MSIGPEMVFSREDRASVGHVERLLKQFLTRKQAGALVEIAYANPQPYANLLEASEKGLTDYFLCRADFEGPALKEMGDKLAQKQNGHAKKLAKFRENAQSMGADIRSIFEIGPGDGHKILQLLNSKLGNDIQTIGFIDKQVAFTNAATRGIKKQNPDIHVTQISQDIFQEAGRHKFSSKVLGMVLGGTVSNVIIDGYPTEKTEYPHQQFVDTFRILSAYYSQEEGGALLVSADTSDIRTTLNGYRDRPGTSYNSEFNLNSLEIIEKIFEEAYRIAPQDEKEKYIINITSSNPYLEGKENISFRDIFRPETKYFSKSQLAAHCLVSDYPCSITIGGPGRRPIELEAGWYNATIISAKPRDTQLIAAAQETGAFTYVDKTQNVEKLTDYNDKDFKRVDVLHFDFKSTTEAFNAPNENKITGVFENPLRMVRDSLTTAGFFGIPNPAVLQRS